MPTQCAPDVHNSLVCHRCCYYFAVGWCRMISPKCNLVLVNEPEITRRNKSHCALMWQHGENDLDKHWFR